MSPDLPALFDDHDQVADALWQRHAEGGGVVVYGGVLGTSASGLPPWWLFTLAIPASMLGTVAGGRLLDRMTDTNFKRWTAWIVTAIGLIYLVRAWQSV